MANNWTRGAAHRHTTAPISALTVTVESLIKVIKTTGFTEYRLSTVMTAMCTHNLRWRWCRTLRCNHRMLCHCVVEMSLWRCTSCRWHHTNAGPDLLYCVRCVLWRRRGLVSRRRRLLWRLLLLLWTRLTMTWHRWCNTAVWGNVNHLWHYIYKIDVHSYTHNALPCRASHMIHTYVPKLLPIISAAFIFFYGNRNFTIYRISTEDVIQRFQLLNTLHIQSYFKFSVRIYSYVTLCKWTVYNPQSINDVWYQFLNHATCLEIDIPVNKTADSKKSRTTLYPGVYHVAKFSNILK